MEISEINPIWRSPYIQNRDWFHEHIQHRDDLLITVGDSWTWGDSLGNDTHRLANIYGRHLSDKLGVDWVNIGVCGTDNMNILLKAHKFIQGITHPYKSIQVVITLTELARELRGNNLLNKRVEYNIIKGTDWPTFEDLLAGIDPTQLVEECHASNFLLGYDIELYYAIKDHQNIDDLLIKHEAYIFNLIDRLFDSYLVGRNFTHTYQENKSILGQGLLPKAWVDVIAEQGNIDPYPDNVRVLSSNGLDPLLEFANKLPKEQLLELLNSADQGISWLLNSPYNAKIATKHPLEQAHLWWAEYLYEHIRDNNAV